MSVMEFSSVLSSNSNRSFEEFDVVNDCDDNMMLFDDTNDVSEERLKWFCRSLKKKKILKRCP